MEPRSFLGILPRKIISRFIIICLAFSLIISVFFIIVEYKRSYRTTVSLLNNHSDACRKLVAETVSENDLAHLNLFLETLTGMQHVAHVSVEQDGRIIAEKGQKNIEYFHVISFEAGRGKLNIMISLYSITLAISKTVHFYLLSTLLMFLATSLMFFYLYKSLVGRHFVTIENHLQRFSLDNFSQKLVLSRPENQAPDELDVVVSSINGMQEKMQSYYKAIERKNDELEATNRFTLDIINEANVGITVYDKNLRYVLWNPFMETLTGYKEEEVLGHCSLDVFPHLVASGSDLLLRRASLGEVVTGKDSYFTLPKTGKSGWTSGTYGPRRNARGDITGVIGIITDITSSKESEERLLDSETKNKALLSNIPEYILVHNKGKMSYVNERLLSFLGLALHEMLNTNLLDYLEEEDRKIVALQMKKRMTGENLGDYEITIPSKINGKRRVIVRATPLSKDPLGDYLVVMIDVTERTALMKKLFQASNLSSLGTLASGVAHEINNPLLIAYGYLEILGDLLDDNNIKDEAIQDSRIKLENSLGRIRSIVKNLKDFSNASTDMTTTIRIEETIETVLSLIRAMLDKNGIAVTVNREESRFPFAIIGDSRLLQRMIMSILTNSIEAMENRTGKSILINLKTEENNVKIVISDTGRGMTQEEVSRVFDPFYTTKQDNEFGRGLAMWNVYTTVKSMKGSISISSEIDKGTTVVILFPCTAEKNT